MEEDPHQVLEGIIISATPPAPATAYIYLRYEYGRCYRVMQQAIDEAYAKRACSAEHPGQGFQPRRLLASRRRRVHLRRGDRPDREPRGQASLAADQAAVPGRRRRRFASRPSSTTSRRWPASRTSSTAAWTGSSRWACRPTPRTRATPAATARSSTTSPATSTSPCTFELPLGITVRELIDKHGGGVWKGRKAKGCIPGGISMGFLTAAEFDTPLDFAGPGKVGCLGLGTGGRDRLRRADQHRRRALQHLPLLRPRIVRPVHALPRRHRLDDQDPRPHPPRPRPARGPGHPARRSAATSASCPARRSAAWPTAPAGR